MLRIAALAGLALAATACSAADGSRASAIDSVRARDVELAEFRDGLPVMDTLGGGWKPSRDSLVRSLVRALERRDTAALIGMGLTRAEFAWVYYPTNPQALPPYDLSPQLMWFTVESTSSRGLGRALDQHGGRPLGYAGYRCDPTPSSQGRNTVYGPCTIRSVRADGDTVAIRLFSLVIERGGRFKIASFANSL